MEAQQTRSRSKPLPFLPQEATDVLEVVSKDEHTLRDSIAKRTLDSASQEKNAKVPPTAQLRRRPYMLYLVLLYACLAISSWTMLSILHSRPLTTNSYDSKSSIKVLQKNMQWYRTAKILSSISGVLVIPLTSAVCANSAVTYIQNRGVHSRLTLSHISILADRGWTSPQVFISALTRRGWKAQASTFLVYAMLLNVLGAVIVPLQEVFLGQEEIKVPSDFEHSIWSLTDIPDLFYNATNYYDDNILVARLRSSLTSTSIADYQPLLWQDESRDCDKSHNLECLRAGATFENISDLLGPYITQLPSNYGTGLIRNFAPRMNSSVLYTSVDRSEFPSNCSTDPRAFYIEHTNSTGSVLDLSIAAYSIQVCILNTLHGSPWKSTRDRQDISEQMYLNVNISETGTNLKEGSFKVAVNTTLGYFELPNYANSEKAGKVLANDPITPCKLDCHASNKRQAMTVENNDTTWAQVFNKGPLTMVAMALFDQGSYLDTRTPLFHSYRFLTDGRRQCIGLAPLSMLMIKYPSAPEYDCLESADQPDPSDKSLFDEITRWLSNFFERERMQNALHGATILASQLWLSNPPSFSVGGLDISYDIGISSSRPTITTAGISIISIFLALDLLLLLAMATYAACSATWTPSLDAFAMMRIGAGRAEDLPLLVDRQDTKSKLLNQIPGWVGDADPEAKVGQLQVGALAPLKRGREYHCYPRSKPAACSSGAPLPNSNLD